MTRYKAIRLDGSSFNGTPRVSYLTKRGEPRKSIVRPAPTSVPADGSVPRLYGPGLLHVATTPTAALHGGRWPCRLFEVDPVGDCIAANSSGIEGYGGIRLVREIPAHRALGPQGEHVAEVIERAGKLGHDETRELAAAWAAARDAARAAAWDAARDAAWAAAWDAARDAAWDAARDAAWAAAWDAARDAAWAAARAAARAAAGLVVKDLADEAGPFTPEHYELLTRPWRQVISWTGPGGIL